MPCVLGSLGAVMTEVAGRVPLALRDLDLKPEYRRGQRDLVGEFFVPCLLVAREYLRAAGYFTSGSLALVAARLPEFIGHDGTFRLIASPYLDEEDVAALKEGVIARAEVIERALVPRPSRDPRRGLLTAHQPPHQLDHPAVGGREPA